jgi:hypothetical protein
MKRHFVIPDCQVRPGVPTDHLDWIAQAIIDYKPDRIINIGDFFDMPSLSSHDKPGSMKTEGARYEADVEVGNKAHLKIWNPLKEEIRRSRGKWDPTRDFLFGNHCYRVNRAVENEPKYAGKISLEDLQTPGFTRHPFLKRVWRDGFVYSHFFQSEHSPHAIGGSIENMLNKIGASFVQGHVQDGKGGSKNYACGITRHGFVYGSCYLHDEGYRGLQRNDHFRGVLVLNEVENGECCPMPLSLKYLCKKYEGIPLHTYMRKKYKNAEYLYSVATAAGVQ